MERSKGDGWLQEEYPGVILIIVVGMTRYPEVMVR